MLALRLGCIAGLAALSVNAAQAQADAAYQCGGDVETQAWALWDGSARALVQKAFIDDALKGQGDSYGLYDLQATTHNLLAMAVRCGRAERMQDFARLVQATYDELAVVSAGRGLGWICRGGRVCKAGSSLHNTEVPLTSSQFMGLAMRVASALAVQGGRNEQAGDFVAVTAMLAVDHLNRWAHDPKLLRLDERLAARPEQARDGQSKWFFTDIDLWILAMYAELAGIQDAVPALREHIAGKLQPAARERLQRLLQLLRARLTLSPSDSPRLGGKGMVADLDRGWWRHYRDNAYAGYSGKEPPVSCGDGKAPPRVNVKSESVPVVDSGGWDFSHARRLVHVIDALDRQRAAMVRAYKVAPEALPTGLAQAFANALVARVWNGDAQRPLFANYWDGSNGWYRAGHISAGSCFEGHGPSTLSDAFALGGFALWSRQQPQIGALARRIHALAGSTAGADVAFVRTYYPGLAATGSSSVRTLARLQFWPSLVEAPR